MEIYLDKNLIEMCKSSPKPIYCVGGYVRNYLIDGKPSSDVDLASSLSIGELSPLLKRFGFQTVAEYKRTGTAVFVKGKDRYEYTSFRKDSYTGGGHTPDETVPTESVFEDALRRDFKCNAVYYDIASGKIVDPLGGVEDVKNKILSTVKSPEEVFSHDGLRLLRLARFAGELNFTPTESTISGARKNAANIREISAERIYAELKMLLVADGKYPFSDKSGHYAALKVLDETRVLDEILPEISAGRGMAQREDFHRYDVLNHILKAVYYADKSVRLAALFHDVAKPLCFKRDGNYHTHAKDGVMLTKNILTRLKAENAVIKETCYLVGAHMYDLDGKTSENKIRREILENREYFEKLILLKQADFSACKDDISPCPTVVKWRAVYEKMLVDGTPFTVKDLKITAEDLINIGYNGEKIGKELKKLLILSAENPERNTVDYLTKKAEKDAEATYNYIP